MPAPEHLVEAVASLAATSGYAFQISDRCVSGTQLYVVHAANHPFSAGYTVTIGTLGFRVAATFPDSEPEDSFFIAPADVKLRVPDSIRNSIDLNRAAVSADHVRGVLDIPVLVFSWHLWNKPGKWDRRKHTLIDHYGHVIRRFEQPEHD